MISAQHKQALEDLPKTHYGEALKAYLKDELEQLQDVLNCTTLKDMEGRQHAIKLIKRLFYFMGEKKVQEKTPNQYV